MFLEVFNVNIDDGLKFSIYTFVGIAWIIVKKSCIRINA